MDEERVLNQLKTAKEQVLYLLDHFPHARNNDFYLQILWLKKFGKLNIPYIDYPKLEEFSGRLETVRRVRQKIQNEDHMYPPTVITQRQRTLREKSMRKAINKV